MESEIEIFILSFLESAECSRLEDVISMSDFLHESIENAIMDYTADNHIDGYTPLF